MGENAIVNRLYAQNVIINCKLLNISFLFLSWSKNIFLSFYFSLIDVTFLLLALVLAAN